MKLLNLFFKILSAILVVIIIAVIVFVSTFDVNNYKAEIIEQVENTTGRTFAIDGDMNLSIFPWIGFKIDKVSLGNAKGFEAAQFASIDQLDIKVHLLPLLKKEFEVKKLYLHGLELSLEIAKDESNNWSSFTELSKGEVQPDLEKAKEETESTPPISFLSIQGFEFTDSVIRYNDRSTNMLASLSALNLQTGVIQFDEPTDIDFSARVESNQPVIDTRLKVSTNLTFNKEFSNFKLRDFMFSALAKKNEFLPQEENVEIQASVDVMMDDQLVTIKQLKLNALGVTTIANITVEQFLKTPLIQGDVEVKQFNANDIAKRLAIDLPEMANKDSLQKVALKTRIKLQGEKLEADNLVLSFDGNTLSGWLHVLDLSKQKISYDLSLDKINVDDYLAKADESVKSDAGKGKAAGVQAVGDQSVGGNEKIVLPIEMLRKLNIQGALRVATASAKSYEINQLVMSTQASNGLLRIKPLTMEMLDGKISSAVTVNVQSAVPSYAVNLNANQVKMGPVANPFLKDVMGDDPAEIDGAVDLKVDVSTAGETINQLKKASKGPVTIDMKKTSVNNFDPEFYMRSSLANYFDAKGLDLSKKLMGNYKPNNVTVFETIHGIFNMSQGKIQTNDFLMDSDRVQVGAEGSADIVLNSMDVLASIKLPKEKASQESAVEATSPAKTLDETLYVRIKGPFDALEYKLDTERLKKSISDAAKGEVKAKVEAEKQKAKAKVDEERARAEEKAKAKVQEKTDEIKDKLKDKFKGLF